MTISMGGEGDGGRVSGGEIVGDVGDGLNVFRASDISYKIVS